MRFAVIVLLVLLALNSCVKARKCQCEHVSFADSTTKTFFINGTKKDSQKACVNMADSIETCKLNN